MKTLSWYILLLLILLSINEPKKTLGIQSDVLFGFSSYLLNDLPTSVILEGCKCGGSKIVRSADGIFSKPCQCGQTCVCKKEQEQGMSIKSDDCDILKSMNANSPYRKFLPKQKGKELWCLKVKTKEDGSNWCAPCKLLDYEFTKMKKTNWTIDEDGTLEKPGTFHIRVVDFEHFEELPSYFTEVHKDKDGNIKMNHDGSQQGSASLPTLIFWEDGKIKVIHKGFLNSFGMLKLFDGKPIVKGTDDVPTK